MGANLARALAADGHRVRATRRASSRVDHLADLDVEWVEAHLGDPEGLARAFEGADVVFHCAAAVTVRDEAPPQVIAANVEGTGNVLRALLQAGAGRLVHCSSAVTIGLSEDGKPSDEGARFNFREYGLDDGYTTTKYQAELLVKAAAAEGVDAVIVNPTYMFGPYDARPSSGQLIVDVVRGRIPGYTGGANNFVDVRDVARGMILAWERGVAGERYILGHEDVSYREIFRRIAQVAGVKPPGVAVPRFAAQLAGLGGDLYQALTGRDADLNSATVRWAYATNFTFTSARARRELGYSPGPIEPAIAAAVDWFRGAGML